MGTISTLKYPPARRSDHVDVYESAKHGQVQVPDPYEWLEHKSDETDEWIEAQATLTNDFLIGFKDRENLAKDFTAAYNFEKFSVPSQKGDGRWYWSFNSGLDPHAVIRRTVGTEIPDFSRPDLVKDEEFFDPNLLSDDKTAALQSTRFSGDGKYFAYAVSRSGSDFATIYVRSTDSPFRKDVEGSAPDFKAGQLSDEIRFVKFSGITWSPDSKGFFYARYPDRASHGNATDDKAGTETEEDKWHKLYYHRLGTEQSEDIIVYEDLNNPEYMFSIATTYDDKYLMLTISKDTARKYKTYIADLTAGQPIGKDLEWIKFEDKFESEWAYIVNTGTRFFFLTNKDAPRHRIVSVDIADPTFTSIELLPEDKDASLEDATVFANDHIALTYSRNVQSEVYIYKLEGDDTPTPRLTQLERVAGDWVGTISVYGTRLREQPRVGVVLSGFTSPGIAGMYDATRPVGQRWKTVREHVVKGLQPEEFISEQVWFTSKDGTKVPMFVVRHRDTPLDGTAPAFQYGYGGFSISLPPRFSSAWLTFAKRYRAIIASVNLRGGAEFGEEWHEAGMKDKKMNVFNDFIAASQWLVQNNYAAKGKVIINGGSNGGLLVGACVNIADEGTFGAAIAEVGVLDMLKFHKFTIGKAWTGDFGNPSEPADFDYIYPYSPLHNVPKDKILPPVMLMTADHDDRVVPLHSFKFAAELQHSRPDNPHPLLIRIERKTGHGAGKSTEMIINDQVDRYGFAAHALSLKYYDD
ncbi:prolyl oligopeptidase [Auriculariales sp. MPI-PUGE-AT-0066]|nr:prolyl oligopeptidase [Auriculariales sp. MPI-PUGE-AT-0066]